MNLRALGLLAMVAVPSMALSGEGTRVAVVDVSTVFTGYKKVHDVQRTIDNSFEQEKRKLLEDTRGLQEKVREVEQMRRDAPEPNDFVFEQMIAVQRRQFELRKRHENFEKKRNKRYLDEMQDVLNEIRAAIAKAADGGGYDLVLRSADLAEPEKTEPEEVAKDGENEKAIRELLRPKHTLDLVIQFKKNPVLFGSAAVDLTEQVLKDLNQDYAKRAKTAPAEK